MTWPQARSRLVTDFTGLAISSPSAQSIVRVYATPPANVEDLPCVVLYPPAVQVTRGPSSRRQKLYTVRCRFLMSEERIDVAAEIVDGFREAAIDVLDIDVTLEGAVSHIASQRCEEAASFAYGDRQYVGFDCLLDLQLVEQKDYAP
jgi:hypothetical protein